MTQPNSAWREIGDTTESAFIAALKDTPLSSEARAIYAIARPHSKLIIAQGTHESRLAKDNLPAQFNWLGQRPRGGDGFKDFDSYAACARYWYGKITDASYAYASTRTLAQYIHVYAPSSDGNDEAAYVVRVITIVDRLPGASDPVPPAVRGHVPKPPVVRSWVTDKRVGHGRDANQLRAGRIVGTCHHTMEGYLLGTDQYFHNPEVASLTDYGIGGPWDGQGNDGVIYEWIDPKSMIVPWANGTVGDATAPYGDAPAFLNAYGVGGVNSRLRSIETSDGAQSNRDKGGREIESLCFLTAYIHAEEAGQTADTFQWNMHHREFGVDHQQCPGAWIINNVNQIQDRTKAIMTAYQTSKALAQPLLVTYPKGWAGPLVPLPEAGGGGDEPTPPPPPGTKYVLARGLSSSLASELLNPGGAVIDPRTHKAIVYRAGTTFSQLWLEHCYRGDPKQALKRYEEIKWIPVFAATKRGDGKVVYQFTDGYVIVR